MGHDEPGTGTPRPRERRRPADRKELILAAAARRFHASGFHSTAMQDIASEVGITAGALYRHVGSKQELLCRCVVEAMTDALARNRRAGSLDALLDVMTGFALDRPDVPILFRRDLRAVPSDLAAPARESLIQVTGQLVEAIRRERPDLPGPAADLLRWAVVGVLSSPAYDDVARARPEIDGILLRIAGTVCSATPRAAPAAGAGAGAVRTSVPVGPASPTRRERLLDAALELCSERGYHGAGLDEIGGAAGISGPSVYAHFPSKARLWAAAMDRGAARLDALLDDVAAVTRDGAPGHAVRVLLTYYARFAVANEALVAVMLTEAGPVGRMAAAEAAGRPVVVPVLSPSVAAARRRLLRMGRELIERSAGCSGDEAAVRSQAVIVMTDTVAQVAHLSRREETVDQIVEIGRAVAAD